jgi:transcription-repair coupling factor (superfamily II helicase)
LVLPAKEIMEGSDDQASASLFDYLNPRTILAIDDPFEVEREGETFWHQISERFDRAVAKGKSPPVPDRWYLPLETVKSNWGDLRRLLLGEMDIPELEAVGGETLRFTVESNDDIRAGLKYDIRAGLKSLGKRATLLSPLVGRLKSWHSKGYEIIIVAHQLGQAERLQELLMEYQLTPQLSATSLSQWWEGRLSSRFAQFPSRTEEGDFIILTGNLSTGFRLPSKGLAVITEEEIFGPRKRIAKVHRRPGDAFITSFSELNQNDYVGSGFIRG